MCRFNTHGVKELKFGVQTKVIGAVDCRCWGMKLDLLRLSTSDNIALPIQTVFLLSFYVVECRFLSIIYRR